MYSHTSWKWKVFEQVFEILSNVFLFKYICIYKYSRASV